MSTAGEPGQGIAEEMMPQAVSSPDPPNEEPESQVSASGMQILSIPLSIPFFLIFISIFLYDLLDEYIAIFSNQTKVS